MRQQTYPTHPATRIGLRTLGILLVLAASACGTAGGSGQRFDPQPGVRQRGLASFYSDGLAGRPTASGEPYRPEALTAAHRALPLGTRVRVVRLDRQGRDTGQSVVVRINDRGPYSPKRVIDLSRAAARALDMIRAGVVPVEIEVVEAAPRRRRR